MMLNNETADPGSSRSIQPNGMNLNIYSSSSIRRPVLFSMKTAPALQTSPTKGKEMVDLLNSQEYRIPELQICEKVKDLCDDTKNHMIIIFDLTTAGSLVSSADTISSTEFCGDKDVDTNNNKKTKDIYRVHLSLPSTLVKRPKFHFEKLLQTVIDDSKRLKLLNLIENCDKFLFFDGVSTLVKCSVTTYWLIKKFNSFLGDKLGKPKTDLFILEKMHKSPKQCMGNEIDSSPTSLKNKDVSKGDCNNCPNKINLTVKVLPRSSEKMFIQSIKKDTIHYSPTSLRKFFNFEVPSDLNENDCKLPNWLKPFVMKDDNGNLLQKLLKNFEYLESLELKRLERGLTIQQRQQQLKTSSERNLQKSKSYQKIYSLSSLQKEFKSRGKFSQNGGTKGHKKSSSCPTSPSQESIELKLYIPKNNIQMDGVDGIADVPTFSILPPNGTSSTKNDSSSNTNEIPPVSDVPSPHPDTDSDSLLTPMNHYEMSEGIRSFAKNRYSNILPYEHSRVKLQPSPLCELPSTSYSIYSSTANEEQSDTDTNNNTKIKDSSTTCPESSTKENEGPCTNNKKRRNSCSISPPSSTPISYFSQDVSSTKVHNEGQVKQQGSDPKDHFNDYFNANYLKLPQVNGDFEYIATQAPLPSTIDDFWKVISTNGVKVIISLNSNDELFMRKWDIYWNNNRSNQKYKVDMVESFDNVCGVDGCILRIFSFYKNLDFYANSDANTNDHGFLNGDKAFNGNSNKASKNKGKDLSKLTVYQLQYTKWLDSCGIVMEDILNLYTIKNMLLKNPDEFINDLRCNEPKSMSVYQEYLSSAGYNDVNPLNKQPPLLVHCSAGCGRTGVFITLDFLLNILSYPTNINNKIDVWRMSDDLIFITVNELRKQRISMVQNLTQYITCYEAILEYFSLKKKELHSKT